MHASSLRHFKARQKPSDGYIRIGKVPGDLCLDNLGSQNANEVLYPKGYYILYITSCSAFPIRADGDLLFLGYRSVAGEKAPTPFTTDLIVRNKL